MADYIAEAAFLQIFQDELIFASSRRNISNMSERAKINIVTGRQVLDHEGLMATSDLAKHWAEIFPQQVEKLDENLSVAEVVDLISTSRVRGKLAVEAGLIDHSESWYAIRDMALLKAIEMKTSGNPDIKTTHEIDERAPKEYRERIKFGFKMVDGSVFRTSVAVVTLMNRTNVTREEILAKAGDFDKGTFFEELERRKNGYIRLKDEIVGLTGSEEERIDVLLNRDFSSQELAGLIFKINDRTGFLGIYARKDSVQLSPRTKHRFLMRAADLKRDGTEGIEISERDGKKGSGREVVYSFDREGRPPYITYVKAEDLGRDFPDYKERCGFVKNSSPAN